jgi:glycosyltransferase involved in cell wall biosynthesis
MADDGRLKFIAGDRDAALAALDGGGATIVPESLASRLGLTIDQILRVPSADGGLLDLRVAGIVDTLKMLRADEKLRSRLSAGALVFCQEHFSWSRNAATLETFYEQIRITQPRQGHAPSQTVP